LGEGRGLSRRIHGTIAHDIGVEIVSGVRRPGDLFEGEIEASEALGVSRTAYQAEFAGMSNWHMGTR